MALSALCLLAVITAAAAQEHENCLPGTWLPEGSEVSFCEEMSIEYDGSLLPDCEAFHGQVNTSSFYHVHEYDCGLFWQCGPEGLCLFDCPVCNNDPYTCPEGRLQFDCRYAWPNGPICAWADEVGCHDCEDACNALNCPADQTCDPTTDCRCSDCKTDQDCSAGETCCDRLCAVECGDATTPIPTTTSTTTTPCPNECCSDEDCPPGFACVDGKCVESCSQDSDCEGWDAICNHPAYDNCQYCDVEGVCQNGCAADTNCGEDFDLCTGLHNCGNIGYPGLVKVTVQTYDCTGCASEAGSEGGLVLELSEDSGLTCASGGLDNAGSLDYDNGNLAEFKADEDDGMGACEYANLNFDISGGTAKWTGTGTWTGASENPICFYFFDAKNEYYMIYNCCDLEKSSLDADAMSELKNCRRCVLGKDC